MGTTESNWHVRAGLELPDMIDSRIYPTIKNALGHGKACRRIVVGGTAVTFDSGQAQADEAVRTHELLEPETPPFWINGENL